MHEWLVDTSVLLDVLGADAAYGERSLATLDRLRQDGVLVINPIIYAEVSAGFDTREAIEEALPQTLFRRDPVPWDACFLAGRAFMRYRAQQGKRKRMLADFVIGAHAATAGFGLVSRDRGYARYFNLTLIDPAQA